MFARRRQKKRAKLAPNVVSEPDVVSDVIYVFTMGGPAATSFVCIPEPVGCLVGQVQDLKDLANLRLVNKLFDDVVSPAFFKGAALVTISVPDGSNSRDADSVERLLPLANNPHLRHVRDITFEGISGARAERIVDGMHAQMPLLEAFARVNGSPPLLHVNAQHPTPLLPENHVAAHSVL